MITRATYCTREDVLRALGQDQSSRVWRHIDDAIESATKNIDSRCHRTFHPYEALKVFPWPDPNSTARSWRLWLDGNDLLSITSMTSGGSTLPPANTFLETQRYGPPYTRLETNQASVSAFASGPGSQQHAIQITGRWGYGDGVQAVTTLAGAIASTSTMTLNVTQGGELGVGDLLLIDTERLIVTGRRLITTAQSLQAPLAANASGTSVLVTNGAAYGIGETITLDAESMLITEIAANTLIVDRAVNGTALAAHTGSTIYAPRTLTVTRGAQGTTAATHADLAVVSRSVVPAPVHSLALGEALVEVQQKSSGYARTAGSGDNERTIGSGPGLNDLRDQVETGFARKVRLRAV